MTSLADMPLVLTVEEAARVLRIGRSAAYANARSGELPTIRIGRKLRVPRHLLEQMLGMPQNDVEPGRQAGPDEKGVTAPTTSTADAGGGRDKA